MLPWGHHVVIINKFFNNPDKALFYIEKTIENNWSRAVLLNFADTDLYERQGKAITNFSLPWKIFRTFPHLDSGERLWHP